MECIGGDSTERCSIKADKFKLSQVLRNLLSNACKFVSENHGTIQVVVETINSDNNSNRTSSRGASAFEGSVAMVRISVKDNGCGISKINQGRMFGQYVQFNAGELQQGKGSGLGLWISKSEYYLRELLTVV
jgi:signal transduction histidine kinase